MGKQDQISPTSENSRLTVAIAISLSLHLLVVVAWWIHPPSFAQSDNKSRATPVVRFGIDQSQHQTLSWLGFIDPTPHQAPQAAIDQSALSPEVSEAESLQEPAQSSAAGAAALARIVELRSASQASIGRWAAAGQVTFLVLMESVSKAAQQAENTSETPENQSESAQADAPTSVEESAPSEANPESTQTGSTGVPAVESEKESDAASRAKTLVYQNGKVASRQGLDIKTVKPKWPSITLLTANPRNPLVRVEFASDGTVKSAQFEGIGTGDASVDQTLLNAIYAWTASGKEIDDLKELNPKGVVTATIRIRLR